jgi:tetratricopeptide (TPR) repeat protein
MVKLSKHLFGKDIPIFQVILNEEWEDRSYLHWNLELINSPNLADYVVMNGQLDGIFILKGKIIQACGNLADCYVEISMPEGVVEFVYLRQNEKIKKVQRRKMEDVILSVPIEKMVDYNLYYSKNRPEVGIEVLKKGLQIAQMKWPLAYALACIFREEQRLQEAIDAFGIVIAEGPPNLNYYNYQDRAKLLQRIGNHKAAQEDLSKAEALRNP